MVRKRFLHTRIFDLLMCMNETDAELRAELSRALVEARLKAGWRQSDLAAALKKPQSYVSNYERSQRRLDVVELMEIASILNIDPARLLRRLQRRQK